MMKVNRIKNRSNLLDILCDHHPDPKNLVPLIHVCEDFGSIQYYPRKSELPEGVVLSAIGRLVVALQYLGMPPAPMEPFVVFHLSENNGGEICAYKVTAEDVDEAEEMMRKAGFEYPWGMGVGGLRDLLDTLENPAEPDTVDLNHER